MRELRECPLREASLECRRLGSPRLVILIGSNRGCCDLIETTFVTECIHKCVWSCTLHALNSSYYFCSEYHGVKCRWLFLSSSNNGFHFLALFLVFECDFDGFCHRKPRCNEFLTFIVEGNVF